MRSSDTAFHVWITRGFGDTSLHEFTGTINVPGGFESVKGFRLNENDSYEVDGNTITFKITNEEESIGPNKHLLIVPSEGSDTIEAAILVDGKIEDERFYPYGTLESEPTCAATMKLTDFPLGADLPLSYLGKPAACYLWATRGYDQMESTIDDIRALEELRSVGYLN